MKSLLKKGTEPRRKQWNMKVKVNKWLNKFYWCLKNCDLPSPHQDPWNITDSSTKTVSVPSWQSEKSKLKQQLDNILYPSYCQKLETQGNSKGSKDMEETGFSTNCW